MIRELYFSHSLHNSYFYLHMGQVHPAVIRPIRIVKPELVSFLNKMTLKSAFIRIVPLTLILFLVSCGAALIPKYAIQARAWIA